MKTLRYLILMIIVVIAGCDKEYTADEIPGNAELKKANVPIPLKADLHAVPDRESELLFIPVPGNDPADPDNYTTKRWIIGGNVTHLGKVDSEKSYYEIEDFQFLLEDGLPFLLQSGIGKVTGANGDCLEYTWWAKASLPDFTYVGGMEISGGTGKFEGCSGTSDMVGTFDMVSLINSWTLDGFIIYEE